MHRAAVALARRYALAVPTSSPAYTTAAMAAMTPTAPAMRAAAVSAPTSSVATRRATLGAPAARAAASAVAPPLLRVSVRTSHFLRALDPAPPVSRRAAPPAGRPPRPRPTERRVIPHPARSTVRARSRLRTPPPASNAPRTPAPRAASLSDHSHSSPTIIPDVPALTFARPRPPPPAAAVMPPRLKPPAPSADAAPQTARRKRVLSGVQPTGSIHLGNYFGAIKNWVGMQEEFDAFYCVVDLHAITPGNHDARELRASTRSSAAIYLAAGLDPDKSNVFVQSHVRAHSELCWLLNCATPIGWLEKMIQFKEKARKAGEGVSVGLLDYPVLMAADILLYNADVVPVGEDQRQHLELTRDIAERA